MVDRAVKLGADKIMQLGDFGFWEHKQHGVDYLDKLDRYAASKGVVVYFLDGNHDKTSLLLERYTETDNEGFRIVRPHIRYAPRGHRWTWGAVRFAAFGGAYSVDKAWRLALEQSESRKIVEQNSYRTTLQQRSVDTSGTVWFPEEEMSDADLAAMLADETPVDVLLSHDKPRGSRLNHNRKDLPECWPNQDRIQLAARTLRPALLVHGHLHYRYSDAVMVGDDLWCAVEGLDADPDAAEGIARTDSWMVLPLDAAPARPTLEVANA
jgi:hypothetical protein